MHSLLTLEFMRYLIVRSFSALFFGFSLLLIGLAAHELLAGITGDAPLLGSFIKGVNTAVIALATFELGLVVSKEYGRDADNHIVTVMRRTVPRFISIVCIALALEGLLLVIKYSQLDLAGNLYYAVAIVAAAALLLSALGVFLRFTEPAAAETDVSVAGEPDVRLHPSAEATRSRSGQMIPCATCAHGPLARPQAAVD